jgi:hypothetical protein
VIGERWGATDAEVAKRLPCDDLLPEGRQVDRAITIGAPPQRVFRWLCQLRIATYSYSAPGPAELTPGLDELEVGQRFMAIFRLASFEQDRQLTLTNDRVAVTYAIDADRLHVRIRHRLPRLVAPLDLIMMRKQLRTLRRLSEP